MSGQPDIVEDVQLLLSSARRGNMSRSQFETRRSALLMAAEAELIERRQTLRGRISDGSITGLMAADTRADLDRAEASLREAASLVGLKAVRRQEPEAEKTAPAPRPRAQLDLVTTLDEDPLTVEKGPVLRTPKLVPLERPELGIFARRVGAVLPTAAGAVVFAPVGVLVLMGKLDGWMPIWGAVMVLMALGCGLTARERWENPDPT